MPLNEPPRNMHLIRQLSDVVLKPTSVAIGNFDGLHRGHVSVVEAMRRAALDKRLTPSVLTFEPHPRKFFQPQIPAFRIARVSDKMTRLRQAGVAQVIMPRFNAAFASLAAEEFLEHVLGRQLGARVVVTGENFAFGRARRGDSAMLKQWGAANDIEIITVPPVQWQGQICSSSAIRAAITAGNIPQAVALLGHEYTLSGRVVHGDGRGRTIGFPTANIALPPDILLPAYGVYAVQVRLDGVLFDGVANLGVRPTVSVGNRPSLEAHLFDTMQEIYGKMLSVSLVDRLRPEMKFDGVAALVAQIEKDCANAKIRLKGGGHD